MGGKTYKTRALVLKKTKLKEKDLVVTLLDQEGMLVRAVAKGARRPGGSHAARLELFCAVDAMLAAGASLDVVCDARLVPGAVAPRALEQTACAAPLAELLCLVAQESLAQPRLFAMARAAFEALACAEGDAVPLLGAAALWKVMAQAGFCPRFAECPRCGAPVPAAEAQGMLPFSFEEGGALCAACAGAAQTVPVGAAVLAWCAHGLRARFADLAAEPCPADCSLAMMALARTWARVHLGRTLKSVDFALGSGLFEEARDRKEARP